MATVYRYRVWCDTESGWQYVWAESEPTDCPNNNGHTIDSDKTAVMESAGTSQTYTAEGAAVITKKDRGELAGNSTIMKRLDAELAPESSATKEWVIPFGKTWCMRLFSSSVMAFEVESRMELYIPDGQSGFDRSNPFENHSDEPVSMLKLDGNSDSAPFYEGLRFVGDGSTKIRITIENKDALDSVEASAYCNGYESDSIATSAPTVDAPISSGATSVSGTSAEADGTTVQVHINGTPSGTAAAVSGGTWTKGGLAALSVSDEIQAKATAADKTESDHSNRVTVA